MPGHFFVSVFSLMLLACSAPRVTTEFTGPPGSGEPNLFATADGRVLMTWFEASGDEHLLKVAERTDDGAWGTPMVVARGSSFFVNWADFPSVTELTDGTWVVHWLEKVAASTYAYHVKLVLSRDKGRTWSDPLVPHTDRSPTEHGFVSMVPWGEGTALIWLDGREMQGTDGSDHGPMAGAMTIRATTLDNENGLGEDVLVDDRTCECCTTSLVRTSRGLLAAYRDRAEGEIRDIAVARYDGERWSAPTIVAADGWHYPGCPVNGPRLASVHDTVAVAWFTAARDTARVQVAFSTDAGESFGAPIRVDDGMPRGRADIVFDQSGRAALVSWLESTATGAEVRARTVHRDGTQGASWVVGRTEDDRASGFPRMVTASEEVLFAWTVPGDAGGVRVVSGRWGVR